MIETFLDHNGDVRKLGYVAPQPGSGTQLLRASRTSIQSYRLQNGLPALIPRSEWREVDFISPIGKRVINNQKSCSGCTGWSCAQGMMRARAIRGQEFVKLSGAAVYAQINNNQDEGSNIGDAMLAVEKYGTCAETLMDFPNIFPAQIPAEALIYKEEAIPVTASTFDEFMTGLQMNMIGQFPVDADRYWQANKGFDANGVAHLTNTQNTNHSVHGALAVCINGTWYIGIPNSWQWWGPWVNADPPWYEDFLKRNNITPVDASHPLAGCCLLSEDHINNGAMADDGFLHGFTLQPQSAAPGVEVST